MARMTARAFGALVLALGVAVVMRRASVNSAPPAAAPAPPPVDLKVANFKELGEAIRAQQGRVVVVDAWATWCVPCMKGFPHLVQLHQKYGKDGLVCISVSLDEKDNRAAALEFLKKQGAAFPNYLLDAEAKVWQDKWDVNGPPVLFVFDRASRRAARFDTNDSDGPICFDDVERLVRKLLREGE